MHKISKVRTSRNESDRARPYVSHHHQATASRAGQTLSRHLDRELDERVYPQDVGTRTHHAALERTFLIRGNVLSFCCPQDVFSLVTF